MIRILRFLPWLCVLALAASPAAAQSSCPNPCTIARGEAFTVAFDTNASAPGAGPVAEYRLYMGQQGGTLQIVSRVAAGSPQIADGVVSFPNAKGITAPDGTYVLVLGAANGTTTGAVETRSDPLAFIVSGAVTPPTPAPPKPTNGRFTKP